MKLRISSGGVGLNRLYRLLSGDGPLSCAIVHAARPIQDAAIAADKTIERNIDLLQNIIGCAHLVCGTGTEAERIIPFHGLQRLVGREEKI